MREGVWRNRQGQQLSQRTVGVIGCGNVGKDLAVMLRSLGCVVLSHDILDFPEFYAAQQIVDVELDDLLRRADVVSLHVPLDDSTRGMLSADRLALDEAGRRARQHGPRRAVDEAALKDMLSDGRLGGAAFDVFATEPPQDEELLTLPTFLATPHIGGSSEEAALAMGRAAIRGLDDNRLPGAKLGTE